MPSTFTTSAVEMERQDVPVAAFEIGCSDKWRSSRKMRPPRHLIEEYTLLNGCDSAIYHGLREYVLSGVDMLTLGYPVWSKSCPGRAFIFKDTPLNVNANDFVPRDGSTGDGSTPPLVRCRESPEAHQGNQVTLVRRNCARCKASFFMAEEGGYVTLKSCVYHWGKLCSLSSDRTDKVYSCCQGRRGSEGCTRAGLHVWNGVDPGRNGPFDGYVRTRKLATPPQDGNYGVYAVDCEMCFTTNGLELTKISVVGLDGNPVYDTFVSTRGEIVDYNTRFSGITAQDFSEWWNVKTLEEVQNELIEFISADTILIGHGLENDLRALRMVHQTVVDTAVVFPHHLGLPFRNSLKSLVFGYLNKDIQQGSHDSYQDACSCLELVLWRLRQDLYNCKVN